MRGVLLIFVIVFAFGCADKSKIPKDIIPQERMEKIMWDMLQADRFVNQYVDKPGDTVEKKEEMFKVYQKVFNLHGISRDEFLKSYKFYLGRPDITRTIFDSISAQAERKRKEIYETKVDTMKRKSDSARARIDSLKRKIKK